MFLYYFDLDYIYVKFFLYFSLLIQLILILNFFKQKVEYYILQI